MRSQLEIAREVDAFFDAQFALALDSDDPSEESHSLYCAIILAMLGWAHRQPDPDKAVAELTSDTELLHRNLLATCAGRSIESALEVH